MIPGAPVLEAGAMSVLCYFESELRGAWLAAVTPNSGLTPVCCVPFPTGFSRPSSFRRSRPSTQASVLTTTLTTQTCRRQSRLRHTWPLIQNPWWGSRSRPTQQNVHIIYGPILGHTVCRIKIHWCWYRDTSAYTTVKWCFIRTKRQWCLPNQMAKSISHRISMRLFDGWLVKICCTSNGVTVGTFNIWILWPWLKWPHNF